LPLLTLTGCPVHVPNRCRSGVPAVSQISSPTRDHAVPEFVHDTTFEFDVDAEETAFQVIEEPPVVYPVPPPSSVMATVAVGVLVPRRILVAATVEYAVLFKIAARRAVASA
jgi:hypothetical protein